MELPRRAELLRTLLDETTQWLGEYGPYARTLGAYGSALNSGFKEPDRRALIGPILSATAEELQRRQLALKLNIEAFLPYFGDSDVEIYRTYRLLDRQHFEDGPQGALDRLSGWIAAVEQMVERVERLRGEVMAKLDAMSDEQTDGRSPTGEVPAGRGLVKARGGEDILLDRESATSRVDSPSPESSGPTAGDFPTEPPLKGQYLGLIIDEGQRRVGRLGVAHWVDFARSRVAWGLLKALLGRGRRFRRSAGLTLPGKPRFPA